MFSDGDRLGNPTNLQESVKSSNATTYIVIGNSGLEWIAKALRSSNYSCSHQTLDVECVDSSKHGLDALADSSQVNDTLKCLNVMGNNDLEDWELSMEVLLKQYASTHSTIIGLSLSRLVVTAQLVGNVIHHGRFLRYIKTLAFGSQIGLSGYQYPVLYATSQMG
jgi:hypothetical protein